MTWEFIAGILIGAIFNLIFIYIKQTRPYIATLYVLYLVLILVFYLKG